MLEVNRHHRQKSKGSTITINIRGYNNFIFIIIKAVLYVNELPIIRNDYAEVGRSLILKVIGQTPLLYERVTPVTSKNLHFNSKSFHDSKENKL